MYVAKLASSYLLLFCVMQQMQCNNKTGQGILCFFYHNDDFGLGWLDFFVFCVLFGLVGFGRVWFGWDKAKRAP